MATLNLEADNVFEVEMTVEQARDGDTFAEMLEDQHDQAQAYVFTERGRVSYLVIKIKDK